MSPMQTWAVPEHVAGYFLEPEGQSFFKIVVPEATTNLVTNPSVERGTTNYSALGGALAQTFSWQAYGAAGLILTPIANTECGLIYGATTPIALSAGSTYTASITFQGEAGKKYYIWFGSTAGVLVGTKREWIGTGIKQRIHVTYAELAGASRRVYVTRDARYSDVHAFYADGLQVEAKPYPTTYCDGDMKGFILKPKLPPYGWNGTPYASTSYRTAQTRSGGREMSLLTFGFRTLAILGLGLSGFAGQALPVPGYGEIPRGISLTAKEFTIVGAIDTNGRDSRALQALRSNFIDAVKPDQVSHDSRVLLRYQNVDCDGNALSESLDIPCSYIPGGGLDGNWDNHNDERIALSFKLGLPFIQNTYTSGATLGFQTTVDYFANIGYRDTDGQWKAMGRGADSIINCMAAGPDGSIYVGGIFTEVSDSGGSAVANTGYIAKWTGNAWQALGTGLNGFVFAIAVDAAGAVYVGGAFSSAGGVGGADYIAKWDGLNWTALGTGTGGNVYAIAIGGDGSVYAGGNFLNLTDGSGDYISKWTGTGWVSLGTGMQGGIVYALAVDKDGSLYAGGAFTTAGGVTGTAKIAKWDGIAWTPLSTGMNNTVKVIKIAPSGAVFAGGLFTTSGGVLTNRIARWSGSYWEPVGGGVNGRVDTIDINSMSEVYAGGIFTTSLSMPPTYSFPDRMAISYRGVWRPMDVNVADTSAAIYSILTLPDGRVYVGGGWAGTTAIAATVTTPDVGGAAAYPTFIITGPGTLRQIKNYSTGKSIYLSNLSLLAGEIATLAFSPNGLAFSSTFRSNLLGYILTGSDPTFELAPGPNNISAYLFGSTDGNSAISMWWRPQEWALDGAAIQ